jgi:hypothetical protein
MIGNYCVERTIGRGQFGKVKLAYHRKLPDMKVPLLVIYLVKRIRIKTARKCVVRRVVILRGCINVWDITY